MSYVLIVQLYHISRLSTLFLVSSFFFGLVAHHLVLLFLQRKYVLRKDLVHFERSHGFCVSAAKPKSQNNLLFLNNAANFSSQLICRLSCGF